MTESMKKEKYLYFSHRRSYPGFTHLDQTFQTYYNQQERSRDGVVGIATH
jgi:hypothetical protein